MSDKNSKREFTVDQSVKRIGESTLRGVVKEVRTESTATSIEAKEKSRMYLVLWDNGTLSVCGTGMIEPAS